MMKTSQESYSGTVNNKGNTYVTLSTYNQGNPGMSPPVPKTTESGYYVVPTWEHKLSLDTLQKGDTGTGYASIIGAYGESAGDCNTQYEKKSCM